MASASPDPKYRAFISYSHRDTAWAKWLHRYLEGFHVDKDLAAAGQQPTSLRPIFRDRDDFTAGHNLGEATKVALDASAALIVLCSPAAAESQYVNNEVKAFRDAHPFRHIIPVILDGTPGVPERECFPPALASGGNDYLLAADVREVGDGKHLAVAKVVARLLGLNTDDVFRRAERARRRRLQAWVAGALTVAVLTAVLGLWSELNRRRFNTMFELASSFRSFGVADETSGSDGRGWDESYTLASKTLRSAKNASERTLSQVKILWFDDKPETVKDQKEIFLNSMRGVGVKIHSEDRIDNAIALLATERFDVIISNFGGPDPQMRFAYRLIDVARKANLTTPLVIYSFRFTPRQAKEARCYGAMAQVRTIGTLFAWVIQAVDRKPTTGDPDLLARLCAQEKIAPYDSIEWQKWITDVEAGLGPARPPLPVN